MIQQLRIPIAIATCVAIISLTLATHPSAAEKDALSDGYPCPLDSTLTCVMSGLDSPRGLAFDPDGALYVAEAGRGAGAVPSPATDPRCFTVSTGAIVCYGPTGENLHGVDEWVDLESIADVAIVIALLIRRWMSYTRMQAARCPASRLAAGRRSSGSTDFHSAFAIGQRGLKRPPAGLWIELGVSPPRICGVARSRGS